MRTSIIIFCLITFMSANELTQTNVICSKGINQAIILKNNNKEKIKLILCESDMNEESKKAYLFYYQNQK